MTRWQVNSHSVIICEFCTNSPLSRCVYDVCVVLKFHCWTYIGILSFLVVTPGWKLNGTQSSPSTRQCFSLLHWLRFLLLSTHSVTLMNYGDVCHSDFTSLSTSPPRTHSWWTHGDDWLLWGVAKFFPILSWPLSHARSLTWQQKQIWGWRTGYSHVSILTFSQAPFPPDVLHNRNRQLATTMTFMLLTISWHYVMVITFGLTH